MHNIYDYAKNTCPHTVFHQAVSGTPCSSQLNFRVERESFQNEYDIDPVDLASTRVYVMFLPSDQASQTAFTQQFLATRWNGTTTYPVRLYHALFPPDFHRTYVIT